VFNKVDRLAPAARAVLAETGAHMDVGIPARETCLVSATTGEGVDALLAWIATNLPEGPHLYPGDDVSTQPLRFFVAEFVREVCLEQLGDEVPYAVACVIEEFREDRTPVYIRATIHVERESQKGIVIGARGHRIRELGRAARVRIEALVGAAVFLDLRVKVASEWRREPRALDRMGYRLAD
jgi:GTP-binding protein Era